MIKFFFLKPLLLKCSYNVLLWLGIPHIESQTHFSLSVAFFLVLQAGLTVRAVQKYLLGTDMTLFTTEHMDGGAPTQPYPSNSPGGGGTTIETTETYQSPPFTENNAAPTYQVPIY